MASTFLPKHTFLFSLLVFFSTPSSSTASPSKTSSLAANVSPRTQADKLIRGLNLFPRETVNIGAGDVDSAASLASGGKIVESRLKLPLLGSSGSSIQDLGRHARMFYYFFRSRNNVTDPVVLWLAGGPGSSGATNLFNGIGPYYSTNDLTRPNIYGWDKVSNIIFVDQPIGTGFSYSTDKRDIRHDQHDISNDLYDFLQGFFTENLQLTQNDFYIAGESYAGHYIPALATRVQQGNRLTEGIPINLKGFAIGNGLTNSGVQYGAYTEYALRKNLIKQDDKIRIDKMFPNCGRLVQQCDTEGGSSCEEAFTKCESIYNEVKNNIGKRDEYDIQKECGGNRSVEFLKVEIFLNRMEVRNSLGVGNIEFKLFREEVFKAMHGDIMKNLAVGIPTLLEDGLKVLIYAGEEDLRCNYIGIFEWVKDMKWYGQADFNNSGFVDFIVDGNVAGRRKTHGPLTFLTVNEAGHFVPMDQPKVALQMIQHWMAANVATVTFEACPYSEIQMQDVCGEPCPYSEIQMQDVCGEPCPYSEIQMQDVCGEPCPYLEIQMQDVCEESFHIQKYICKMRPRKMETKGKNKRVQGKQKQKAKNKKSLV